MQRLHNPVKCTFFFWRILTDKIFKTSSVCLYGLTFHIFQFVIINYLLKKTHRTQMCKCALSLKITSATKWQLLKMCHLRHRLRIFLFCTKIMFRSQDIQVFVFLTIPWFTESVTSRVWVLRHEYEYMRQGAFLNICFEPQLMKSPNLANWQIYVRAIIFSNLLNNLEDWG